VLDGDVDVYDVESFVLVVCLVCWGLLKLDVVFFGENVLKECVYYCYELVEGVDVLFVVGMLLIV